MFGMGVPELVIILVVVLIIFGPKNLPKLGASIGKTVKNFRNETEGTAENSTANKAEATTSASSDAAEQAHVASDTAKTAHAASENATEKASTQ